jgi:hypothetical protein
VQGANSLAHRVWCKNGTLFLQQNSANYTKQSLTFILYTLCQ